MDSVMMLGVLRTDVVLDTGNKTKMKDLREKKLLSYEHLGEDKACFFSYLILFKCWCRVQSFTIIYAFLPLP